MDINSHISKFSPTELATFLVALSKSGNFKIDLSVAVEPHKNELSTKQACAFLDVSRTVLFELTKSGVVKMQKSGNKNIYFRDDLTIAKNNGLVK